MFRKEVGFNYDLERQFLERENYMKSYIDYENRLDDIRLKRQLSSMKMQCELDQLEERRRAEIALRNQEKEENERRIKHENEIEELTLRNQKYRQYVRENSPEIRELETKLKLGYINKIREVQIAEKQLEKARLKAMKSDEVKCMQRDMEMAKIEAEILNKNSYLQKLQYNRSLRAQLEDQLLRQENTALMQLALDKIMIEEIVQKILEEDQRSFEEEIRKSNQFKNDVQQFFNAREVIRAERKKELEHEKEKIIQYLAEQDTKAKEMEESRKQKQELNDKRQKNIAQLLEASRKDTSEEEHLRYELASEELTAKHLAKERAEFEKRLRDRLQLQRTLGKQLQEREEEAEKVKEEDRIFRELMMRKLREEERLEQMTNQKRRMRELEHRRAVEAMIVERKQRREHARQLEMQELESLRRAEAERLKIVEEERENILRNHAIRLLGYLPKSTFRNQEELNLIQDELTIANINE